MSECIPCNSNNSVDLTANQNLQVQKPLTTTDILKNPALLTGNKVTIKKNRL